MVIMTLKGSQIQAISQFQAEYIQFAGKHICICDRKSGHTAHNRPAIKHVQTSAPRPVLLSITGQDHSALISHPNYQGIHPKGHGLIFQQVYHHCDSIWLPELPVTGDR